MSDASPSPPNEERPLRVLLITRAPVGGLWRHILDLTDGLLERGFELGIVVDSLRATDYVRETLERFAPRLSLGVHLLDIPRLPGSSDFSGIRACRKIVHELKPDIVHGHSAKGGLYARMGAWRRPAKAFYTPHGGSLHYTWDAMPGALYLLGEKFLLPLCDQFLFESRYSELGYATKIGAPTGRSRVIFNGLGQKEFAGKPLTLTNPQYDFAFVGEMRAIKGVDLLLQALTIVRSPDDRPARVLMLGDGPMLDHYRSLAERLGVDHQVDFVGRRPVREAFEATNTIVVPSRAESLPYIVMEAIAAGKRVVATNVGGIGEIFGPTRTELIEPESAYALAEAMRADLLPLDEARHNALQARYEHVATNFHVDRMVDQIAQSYRALTTS
ncbi:MAG: glycosyltransferase [Pseudomonadota bacterium]